jgi:hypothetical protein
MTPEEQEDFNLEKSAPSLFQKKKNNPFMVPENYFSTLPTEISGRIQKINAQPWYETFTGRLLRPGLAVAMVLLLIVLSFSMYFITKHQAVSKNETALTSDDISNAELLGEVDESELIDQLTAYNDESNLPTTNSDIDNYLIENEVDINQIIDEL